MKAEDGQQETAKTVPARIPARSRVTLRVGAPDGLSARLLLLTAAFTFAVGALIVAPSAASFQERWLLDRIRAAELASVGVEALPYNLVEDATARQLLQISGVAAVAVQEEGVRRLLLQAPALPRTPELIDLRRRDVAAWLMDPWRTLFGHPDRSIRVMAHARWRTADFIEVVAPAEPLKQELRAFLLNSLLLSVLVAAAAGGLLYAGLSLLVLRPMRRVTASIERFRADPESPSDPPRDRRDEIGRVEDELARMQEEVRQALRSRARLAALGEAVARINHDLRNMLTSAQLASERLASSADPLVTKALPRLERALDRASGLARNVLDYGKTSEPPPELQEVDLKDAAAVAAEDAGLDPRRVRLVRRIPTGMTARADPEQLHRILVNLMRNARQAIEDARGPEAQGSVTLIAAEAPGGVSLIIADDGPGVPQRVADRLFQPFVAASSGGTGLGLAIARELTVNHGGELKLVSTGEGGAVFELRLPD